MNALRDPWDLDPGVTFLNHGSFGACPRAVLERQGDLRRELERQPVRFFVDGFFDRLDAARTELARFVGASPDGLVAVPNATTGVNAVLRSFPFEPGDELLTTDHAYNACANALEFVAQRAGARVRVVAIPFPGASSDGAARTVLDAVSPRTRLVLIDHVTSPTALVLPLERIVAELEGAGVDVLVDGAHAPGMLPLEIERIGCAYYTGNAHKWLCAPKGAGFLWVREDRRDRVRPTVISHGTNTPRPARSRYHDEFDWVGTDDPTAFLSVPFAIEYVGGLVEGGWPAIRERNRALALHARKTVAAALGSELPCPDAMIGSIAALPLPDGSDGPATSALYAGELHDALLERHGIEIPVIPWPAPPRRILRLSAQLYNEAGDYERLAEALDAELARERGA